VIGWFRGQGRQPVGSAGQEPGDHDQAWNVLRLMVDWVRHAETKAAAVLAAAVATGTVLYNLVKDRQDTPLLLDVPAGLCFVFVVLSGSCAGWSLVPRLWGRNTPTSLIYFDHVARRYGSVADYVPKFRALTGSARGLVDELGGQIWANSRVARQKFLWGGAGLILLLFALLSLALTASAVALTRA
jgi:hypothetical protein